MIAVTAPATARPTSESYGMPDTFSIVPKFAYPNPSVRYSYDSRAISREGYAAINTLISSTTVHSRHACLKPSISNCRVFSSNNFIKLIDARLHAVLSRNIYSLHGLLALIRPDCGHVCHSLIVSSYCTPGSAQRHAA